MAFLKICSAAGNSGRVSSSHDPQNAHFGEIGFEDTLASTGIFDTSSERGSTVLTFTTNSIVEDCSCSYALR